MRHKFKNTCAANFNFKHNQKHEFLTQKKRTQFKEEFSPLNLIYYRLLVYFELTEVGIFTNEHLLVKNLYFT